MATRSPTEFHNDWGQFSFTVTPDDQLPNVAGSPTQSATLQAGDTATVLDVPPTKWYCQDPTPGAAVWVQISTGASGQDVRPYRITVGCAAAPYNDTLAVCDILDPGDGSGIAAALALANAFSPTTPPAPEKEQRVDVFLRAGLYDFNQPGSPTGPLLIESGVSLLGASNASVTILGRTTGDAGLFVKVGGGRLADFLVLYDGTFVGASGGSTGVIRLVSTVTQPDQISLVIERLFLRVGALVDPAVNSLRAVLEFENQSGADVAFLGIAIHDCFIIVEALATNPVFDPRTDFVCGIRCLSQGVATEASASFVLTGTFVIGGNAAMFLEDIAVRATASDFGAFSATSIAVYLTNNGVTSRFNDCRIFALGGPTTTRGVVAAGPTPDANFRLFISDCAVISNSNGSNGIQLDTLDGAFISTTMVRGFDTGIRCPTPCANNIVLGNEVQGNVVPLDIDLATNEVAHNIV